MRGKSVHKISSLWLFFGLFFVISTVNISYQILNYVSELKDTVSRIFYAIEHSIIDAINSYSRRFPSSASSRGSIRSISMTWARRPLEPMQMKSKLSLILRNNWLTFNQKQMQFRTSQLIIKFHQVHIIWDGSLMEW